MSKPPKVTMHKRSPRGVEVSLTPAMIEGVFLEWERENPGKRAETDMGPDEFTDRMMMRIRASARIVTDD